MLPLISQLGSLKESLAGANSTTATYQKKIDDLQAKVADLEARLDNCRTTAAADPNPTVDQIIDWCRKIRWVK